VLEPIDLHALAAAIGGEACQPWAYWRVVPFEAGSPTDGAPESVIAVPSDEARRLGYPSHSWSPGLTIEFGLVFPHLSDQQGARQVEQHTTLDGGETIYRTRYESRGCTDNPPPDASGKNEAQP
jgi:hypothetical protein